MKLVSWNVNGIRACLKKGLLDFIHNDNADIYCFQEIKISSEDLKELLPTLSIENYYPYWFTAEKKGYSGLLFFSKIKPVNIIEGLGFEDIDKEARVLTLEFDKFFLINTYFPNAQRGLKRLDFKLQFNHKLQSFCEKYLQEKPLIITGDFNVSHKEIDLKNPKQNQNNACFTPEERNWFDAFLKKGFVDTFREFVTEGGYYTWWTYRYNARERNIGWRLDYFLTSEDLRGKLINSEILKEIMGSDHCPVKLEIDL